MKTKMLLRHCVLFVLVWTIFVSSATSQTPMAASECAQEMIGHYIGNVAPANVGCALNLATQIRHLYTDPGSMSVRNEVASALTSCYPALPNANSMVNKLIDNLNEINDMNATTFGGSTCLDEMWGHIDEQLAAANESAQRGRDRQNQSQRALNNALDEDAQNSASSHAEPHIKTIDGSRYHFQAEGIFTALITTNGKFEIQTLQKGLATKPASQNEAVAIRYGTTVLNFAVKDRSVYLNGRRITPTATATTLTDGLEISQVQPNTYRIFTPRGDSLIVKVQNKLLDLYVKLSPFQIGAIEGGIMGNFDFNAKNDLKARNGAVIAYKDRIDRKLLYQTFGDSWRVEPSKSLFTKEILAFYPKFDVNFPAQLVDVMKFSSAQKRQAALVCQRKGITEADILEDCIHDLALTNDPEFADSAAFAQKVKQNPNDIFRRPGSVKDVGFTGTYTFDYTFSDAKKLTSKEFKVVIDQTRSGLSYKLKNGVGSRFIVDLNAKTYLNVTEFENSSIPSFAKKQPYSQEISRNEAAQTTRTEMTKMVAGYNCRKYLFKGRTVSGELWVAESIKQTDLIPIEYLIGLADRGFNFMATFPKFLSQNKEGMVLEADLKQLDQRVTYKVSSINTNVDKTMFDLTGIKMMND